MRLLNTIYVLDHRARISVRRSAIEIRVDRALAGRFPMEGTEAVILAGAATMTTEALGRCVQRGIRVVSLHQSGRVRFVVSGPTTGNVNLRLAQYGHASDPDLALGIARLCVAGKLQNARRLLIRWAQAADKPTRHHIDRQRRGVEDRLAAVPTAGNADTLRGIEGDATRRYFKALGAHLEQTASPYLFLNRSRRPPRDPVNAALGYAYSLLATACQGALDAVGLDPQIGFLHGTRPGRASLALDLMEEFRPALADRFVAGLFARRQLHPGDFTETAGGAWYLSDTGRKKFLRLHDQDRSQVVTHPLLRQPMPRSLLPTVQATLLARHLRGDLPAYPPYTIQG